MKVTFGPHHQFLHRYGVPYAQALAADGHDIVHTDGDVLLIDADVPWSPWQEACGTHDQVILYPHGAGIVTFGFGDVPRHPNTVANMTVGAGHVELAERASDVPAVACGWPWTPLHTFTPATDVHRILFAPVHAYKGERNPTEEPLTRKAGNVLQRLFPQESGVQWCVSTTPHTLDETCGMISVADLVVTATTTVLALAVALGKPAVFFNDWREVFATGNGDDKIVRPDPKLTTDLVDIARYPYGLRDIDQALTVEATDWRRKFIGGPFDPGSVTAAFDKFVGR